MIIDGPQNKALKLCGTRRKSRPADGAYFVKVCPGLGFILNQGTITGQAPVDLLTCLDSPGLHEGLVDVLDPSTAPATLPK